MTIKHGKTKQEAKVEEMKRGLSGLEVELFQCEAELTDPVFQRDAGLYQMRSKKRHHLDLTNRVAKLKRAISRYEDLYSIK